MPIKDGLIYVFIYDLFIFFYLREKIPVRVLLLYSPRGSYFLKKNCFTGGENNNWRTCREHHKLHLAYSNI